MASYHAPSKIIKHFECAHEPVEVQKATAPFKTLADHLDRCLPRGDEKAASLRHLLEARDAAVRAIVENFT